MSAQPKACPQGAPALLQRPTNKRITIQSDNWERRGTQKYQEKQIRVRSTWSAWERFPFMRKCLLRGLREKKLTIEESEKGHSWQGNSLKRHECDWQGCNVGVKGKMWGVRRISREGSCSQNYFLESFSGCLVQNELKQKVYVTTEKKRHSFPWKISQNKTNCGLSTLSSVQLLSRVQLFVTPWITARQASLSVTNSQSLLKLMSIESVMPSSHLILCRPLLLLSPIPASIRVFSNESTLGMRPHWKHLNSTQVYWRLAIQQG